MDVLGRSILGRGNREFEGPEVERCLTCLRTNRKVCVAGAEWMREWNKRGQSIKGLIGCCIGLWLLLGGNGEPLEGSEQRRDVIWVRLLRIDWKGTGQKQAFTVIQARGGDIGKLPDSEYILVVAPIWFAEWIRWSVSKRKLKKMMEWLAMQGNTYYHCPTVNCQNRDRLWLEILKTLNIHDVIFISVIIIRSILDLYCSIVMSLISSLCATLIPSPCSPLPSILPYSYFVSSLGLKRKLVEIKVKSYVHKMMWGISGAFLVSIRTTSMGVPIGKKDE